MIRIVKTLLCLAATAASLAAATPPEPPTLDETYQGAAFNWSVNGTRPMTFQWWRGTEKNPKVTKIPAPAGIQQTLRLEPPYVAGWYVCEATNVAGTVTSKRFKLATTRAKDAAEMAVTIKVP